DDLAQNSAKAVDRGVPDQFCQLLVQSSCSSVGLRGCRLPRVHLSLLRRWTYPGKAVPIQLQNKTCQIMAPRRETAERKRIVSGSIEAIFGGDSCLESALLHPAPSLAAHVRIPAKWIGEVPHLGLELLFNCFLRRANLLLQGPACNP